MVMNVKALAELNFPKVGNPHPLSELRSTSYLQCYLDEPDSELLLHFRVQVVARYVDFFFPFFLFCPFGYFGYWSSIREEGSQWQCVAILTQK